MQQVTWTADELSALPTIEVDARKDGRRFELKVSNDLGRVWLANDGTVFYERWIGTGLSTLDGSGNPFTSLS